MEAFKTTPTCVSYVGKPNSPGSLARELVAVLPAQRIPLITNSDGDARWDSINASVALYAVKENENRISVCAVNGDANQLGSLVTLVESKAIDELSQLSAQIQLNPAVYNCTGEDCVRRAAIPVDLTKLSALKKAGQ
jgi:hypothetical protein